jgi:ABC-type nitrate/sulfonate/bicarbonate transport system substrate-binding protein
VLGSGTEMSRALQAGEAQFMGAAASNVPVAREQGLAAVGVVGYMHDATTARFDRPVAVVARQEAGAGVGQLEKLAGKKLGLVVGGTGDEYVRALLSTKGVPSEKIEFVNVAAGNQVAALQNGSVDAVAAWEPYATMLLDKVPGSVEVVRGGGAIGYFIMISTSEEVVKTKPELVQQLVDAIAEATQYARQRRDEAAEIATRWVPGSDTELNKKALANMQYDARLSKYSLQNYDESQQNLVDQKKLRTPFPANQMINTSFVEKTQKAHPELFSDLKPIP